MPLLTWARAQVLSSQATDEAIAVDRPATVRRPQSPHKQDFRSSPASCLLRGGQSPAHHSDTSDRVQALWGLLLAAASGVWGQAAPSTCSHSSAAAAAWHGQHLPRPAREPHTEGAGTPMWNARARLHDLLVHSPGSQLSQVPGKQKRPQTPASLGHKAIYSRLPCLTSWP